MKKLILLFLLTFFAFNSFAAKITDDALKIGEPGSVSDKVLKLGDTRLIRSNETSGQLEFTNDGLLYKKIGSGSGSGGDGGVNILANSSFEDGLGDWTTSGGTLTQETYTNALEGNTKYARFVSTTPGEYVESACTTKPDAISGGGMADIRYLGGSGNFDLKVIDCTSGDVEISTGTLGDITEWLKAPTQTFTMTAQYKIRVVSTAAGTIDLDLGYAGSNKGFIASENHAKTISYTPTFTEFGTPTEVDFTYMPIGDKIHIQGRFRAGTLASSTEARVSLPSGFVAKFSDGLTKPVGVYFRHVSNPSNGGAVIAKNGESYLTFSTSAIFNSSSTDPSGPSSSGSIMNNAEAMTINVIVPVNGSPSNTQEAFTPEQADFYVEGIIYNKSGGEIALPASNSILEHGSLELEMNRGAAKISCNSGVSNGATCATGLEQTGFSINAPKSGKYKVCMKMPVQIGNAAAGLLIRYTAVGSDTPIQNGKNYVTLLQSPDNASETYIDETKTCEIFDVSAGDASFKIQSGASGTNRGFVRDNFHSFSLTGLTFSVEMMSHNVSRPVIQNMIDWHDGKRKGTESCKVIYTGTPTIDSASGLCGWIDSLTPVVTGRYTVATKPGVFSSQVVCTASPSTGGSKIASIINETSSSFDVLNYSLAGSLEAGTLNIKCEGLR